MKKVLPFIAVLLVVLFAACLKDGMKHSYTYYRPVYKTKAQVRQEVKSTSPQPILNPGKLFYKDGFVFLNDIEKGVHVIDIKNPSQPKVVSFVAIPGSVDLAVRGNILYADLTTDLVAIDISNPLEVKLTQVLEGVFPHRFYNQFSADTSQIIVDWVRVDTMVKSYDNVGWGMKADVYAATLMSATSSGTRVTNGVGGSMARFALMDDRLYTVSFSDLKIFNTAVPEKPSYIRQVNLMAGGIETIYPFGDHLFLGSQTGMFVFDVTSKDNPVQQSRFEHARVCDPVVSDGKYAYVTLRNGTQCGGFINQLDVVDIADVTRPSLVKSYAMTNPRGLSKDGNILLICDGVDGLRLFDASSAKDVKQLGHLKNINTYDVITLNGIALVAAKEGLLLVNYTQPSNPVIVGTVSIGK